jgi:hypothetical protein
VSPRDAPQAAARPKHAPRLVLFFEGPLRTLLAKPPLALLAPLALLPVLISGCILPSIPLSPSHPAHPKAAEAPHTLRPATLSPDPLSEQTETLLRQRQRESEAPNAPAPPPSGHAHP